MITPGQILKKKRLELRKSLKEVSQETKVQERFLSHIENNEYEKFDSPIFAQGFVKLYAQYLNLNEKKIVALFRREVDSTNPNIKQAKSKLNINKLLTPKNTGIVVLIITIISFITYLNIQFYNYNKPPVLEIIAPQNNISINLDTIKITGKTEEETLITINSESINVSTDNSFEKEVVLTKGLNTITIIATNKINREKEISEVLKITYSPEEEEEPEVIEEAKDIIVKVITEDTAWIQLDIDGEQKVAFIIPAGETEEFIATDSIEIISGRPTITKLYIDGEEYTLSTNPDTGVASLSCNVTSSNKINCSN